jgi:hypothetical protein
MTEPTTEANHAMFRAWQHVFHGVMEAFPEWDAEERYRYSYDFLTLASGLMKRDFTQHIWNEL